MQTTVSPPEHLITSAAVLAFSGDRLLMTRLVSRGWDIPGGHREPDESPLEAVRREVYEETCAHLAQWQVFAHSHIRLNGPKPNNYKYPYPDSYILLYMAHVARLDPFVEPAEVTERGLFPPSEARRRKWVRRNEGLYEAALAFAMHMQKG